MKKLTTLIWGWIAIPVLVLVLLLGVIACDQNDARVASENLSKAADMFEVDRRIVFMNGITDTYMLEIQGRCSIKDALGQLEVTCQADDGFRKHFLGLSDNVTYFVEHLTPTDVSTSRYRVIFKPSVIIPDFDLQ
jgi:hypothetical protein